MARPLTVPEIQELTEKYHGQQVSYSASTSEWLTFHLPRQYDTDGKHYKFTRDAEGYLSNFGWSRAFKSQGPETSFIVMVR